MIRGIIRLENDIVGRAGQLLILREDNSVHVVSQETLEAVFAPPPPPAPPAPEPVVEEKAVKPPKPPKAFGYYKTAEAFARAQARGRHIAELRAKKRAAAKAEAARLAAE